MTRSILVRSSILSSSTISSSSSSSSLWYMLERSSCLHRWQELGGRDRESRPLAGTQG